MAPRCNSSLEVSGYTEPDFEGVRDAFRANLRDRGELGAAFAVYHHGRKVVDLWGGHLDRERTRPWQEDTVTTVFSTTKGIAAMALALAHSRGLIEWDVPVAHYWPEFAQAGKQDITVRQLNAHQAGLSGIDEPLDVSILEDLGRLAEILARQKPDWEPGLRHGYHAVSLGWFQSELLRRVDPQQRSLGRFLREEITEPLGVDFYIGLPRDFPGSRVATIDPISVSRSLLSLGRPHALPGKLVLGMLNRRSRTGRAFANPRVRGPADFNRLSAMRAVEIPSVNGIGDARSIARLYSCFAMGGHELGLAKRTLDSLMEEPPMPLGGYEDLVLGADTVFALGFMKPSPVYDFASSRRAFGTPGAGGSFGFADPDARVGMAYVMNRMGGYLVDDPREKALRDATYRALARVGPA